MIAEPLVSIITAVFNGSDSITNCIESVLNQDYPRIEHIILDGGSTDGTVEILHSYGDRVSLWISEPDSGVYDAWNKGLKLARGEWIAFLGADDFYLAGAISTYMQLANEHPTAEFLTSRARLDHPTGYSPIFGGPWQWPRFSTAMSTIHVGVMHRRSLFERYGNFDTSYRIAADYEFLLRARENLQSAFTPATTVVMRAGGLSDSTAALREAMRVKVAAGVRSLPMALLQLRLGIARFHIRRTYLKARSFFV
ncbi:glycosyltransferase family 2 protein [Granulicella sp. dw_53]|uniref:glycosyltransferase family 2 protein n=1 Tax=Granulicella sp. dw_53 TaxID=2719792 RepID=UPI001BD512B3